MQAERGYWTVLTTKPKAGSLTSAQTYIHTHVYGCISRIIRRNCEETRQARGNNRGRDK